MNINIICIGKLKEKYWQAAVAEYTKRIGGYARIQIVELKESKLPKNASPADESQVMEKEGETILSKIGESDYVIAMEVEGKMLDSVELSRHLTKTFDSGRSTVDFIIGQDVKTQGTLPIRLLYDYLERHQFPKERMNMTDITIKFRWNV